MTTKAKDFYRFSIRVIPSQKKQVDKLAQKMGVVPAHLNSVAWALGFGVLKRTVDRSRFGG